MGGGRGGGAGVGIDAPHFWPAFPRDKARSYEARHKLCLLGTRVNRVFFKKRYRDMDLFYAHIRP